jgi:hypothetical protein
LRFWGHTSGVTLVDEDPICSSKGCRHAATFALLWNNPKLHPPKRRKTWLACSDHRAELAEFLEVRGFLKETEEVDSY